MNNNSNSNNNRSNSNNRSNNRSNNNNRSNSNNRNNNRSNNKLNFFTKYKKYIIYAAIAVVICIIIFVIYHFIVVKIIRPNKSEINIEEQKYLNEYIIENNDIVSPKNGYDYTVSFWIYIDSYEYNINKWKHIFHKGSSFNKNEYNFDNWEELESMINEQSPGVWLHPNDNKIRMAFSTDNARKTCRYIFNRNECIENNYGKRCEWNGEKCKNKNVKEIDEDLGKYEPGDKNVEYLDIENIPLKKMTHITLTLENKILNVYYNGILRKIHTFDNEILFNNGDMFFNMPLTFEGSIFNFKYIPNEINREKAIEIYKDIPFTSNFTKKFRFNNYLGRLKFKDAIKTIFI